MTLGLFWTAQFVKYRRIFLELNSQGLYPCSNSEGENCRSMSTSSINRRIESFHVVVVQWTSKKCTKKLESSCFAHKTNCYWRCCCSSSLSLLKGDVTRVFGNTELQYSCDIVSNGYNIVPTLQRCPALKIVVANRPV